MSTSRLYQHYKDIVSPSLMEKFSYKNLLEVPKLEKIVLNMGVGEASQDKKKIEGAISDLSLISGQKPLVTRAKKSLAGFKIRDGVMVGASVTIRRARMYEFLDRLITIALPRVRDFRGLSKSSFDGNGNYNMGLKEQIVFPEIDYDKVDKVRGLDISICTTAKTNDEGIALLEAFDMPFRKI